MLKIGSKGPSDWTVEVFDSRDWSDEPEAGAGLYRVRVGGKWVNEGGRSHTFFTPEGLGAILARELTTPGALADMDAGRPALRKGQYIRWIPFDLDVPSSVTTAGSDPIQGIDGQWRILVCGRLVLCNEVMGLDRFGREIRTETEKGAA